MHTHDNHNITIHSQSGRLSATLAVNLAIALIELVGGIISGSLALISDAVHNLGDCLSMILSLIAIRVSAKSKNNNKTFGYKRVEILTAFLNSGILIGISVYLVYQALLRFIEPHEIDVSVLLPIAVFGLLGNLAGVFLLKKSSSESLNIKAVYLHLWGDTLSSVAVIFAGIMIHFTGYFAIDTLVTIFISGIIIKEALIVLSQTVNILMQGAPAGTDLEGIKASIISIPYVSNIHHVHIWNLDDSEIFLEAHIKLDNDLKLSQTSEIREKIESILRNKFKISHTTLQLEYLECKSNCN